MTKTLEKDHALEQAQAQLDIIKEMVAELETANRGEDDDAIDAARGTIQDDPLSVEVRSEWYTPGGDVCQRREAAEYRILLCTGGPAVQITGELSQHGEPETARIQYQDWFRPWTDLPLTLEDTDTILAYAQQFYFGE